MVSRAGRQLGSRITSILDYHFTHLVEDTDMNNLIPLTAPEVKALVVDWYKKLDAHAPMVELLPMLADQDLEMRFPEGTVRGHAGFESWYEGVIRIFFDEVHELKQVEITIAREQADVRLVVNWQAHRWKPPAPKSEWLAFDAAQQWVVKRLPNSNRPVVVTYIVEGLTPVPGSASL